MNVFGAKALELGAKVIDADKEDVGLGVCQLGKEDEGQTRAEESHHGGENSGKESNDDLFLRALKTVHLTIFGGGSKLRRAYGQTSRHSEGFLLSRSFF